MTKNTDRVTEAFQGKRTYPEIKDYMNWLLEESAGEHILDAGCSEGLLSIMLAREGKQVVGTDIEKQAIIKARKQGAKEDAPVTKSLDFIHDHFTNINFEKKFDAVILNESFLEIRDTGRFIEKAVSVLNPGGRLLITVPFGLQKDGQHHTYYLHDFFTFQRNQLHLSDIHFFENHIGACYIKDEAGENRKIDEALLKSFEHALAARESRTLEQLQVNNAPAEGDYLKEKQEKVSLQKELYDQYAREEAMLRQYGTLDKQYQSIKRKYDNLRSSKLGQLTVKYWEWRRKRRN